MEEFLYSVLLTGQQGLTLPGTARLQVDFSAGANSMEALAAAPLQRPIIEVSLVPVTGAVVIPLLSGLRPIPVSGVCYLGLFGPLWFVVRGGSLFTPLVMQFNFSANNTIIGGVSWRRGQPLGRAFGMLGTRLALPS